jgi:hypothetical protein
MRYLKSGYITLGVAPFDTLVLLIGARRLNKFCGTPFERCENSRYAARTRFVS